MSGRPPPPVDVSTPWEESCPPTKKFRGTPTNDDDGSVMSSTSTSLGTTEGIKNTKIYLSLRPKGEATSETIAWVGKNPCDSPDLLRLITVSPSKHEKCIQESATLVKVAQFQQGENQTSILDIDAQLMDKNGELQDLQAASRDINDRLLNATSAVQELTVDREANQRTKDMWAEQEREARFRSALSEAIIGLPVEKRPMAMGSLASIRRMTKLASSEVVNSMSDGNVHLHILLLERFGIVANPEFINLWNPLEDDWSAAYGELPLVLTGKIRNSVKLKNRLCDYLQIPGEDITEGPPVFVGVSLESVDEEMSEEELQAKIEESSALQSRLKSVLESKKRRRSSD
jgi:hypothetical protein